MVNLRRRLTRSEGAKQEAESQTNRRPTRFPRNQATNLTLVEVTIILDVGHFIEDVIQIAI